LRGWLARTLQSATATPGSDQDPFQALFEQSTEGLLVCTADGTVLAANVAACRLLAAKARTLVGRPATDILNQDGAAGAVPGALHDGEAVTHGASGCQRLISVRLTPLAKSGGGQTIVHLHDRGEHLQAQARLTQLANYDSLTGLPNRALFRDRLSTAMARAQRTGAPMALMFLDLDRFKLINDSLGHEVGDRLLQHVARTLTHCLRNVDSVAHVGEEPFVLSRLGGDEFTVIVESIGTAEDAALVARRLLDAVNAPFVVGEEEIVVSASIGISMYPTDDVDLDGLIRHTDMAMYRSKSLGRGTYSFFSDDLNAAVSSRVSLEGSLRRAIERSEFQLFFQPKAELRSGGITGVEALVRWHRPGHGIVPPDRFISVLEDTGMILPVGAWVIRAACQQLAAWDRQGLPPMRLAVNLSARQFRHLYLASLVEDSLRENSIDPKRLEIELTESLLMEDTETNRAMMENFRRMGVRLAIDDFGTGHSSLSYIKRFNVDTLKIDRTFVHSLPDSADDMAIVAAVVAMGRSMHMCVVAEGVETIEQAEVLRELGCDEMQGYLLARAMPGADFAAWLLDYKRSRSRRRSRNHFSDTTPITQFTLLDA
jgi:diguanylate cyclase (GGDEF)-like protein